ncbi:uncharacterized protein B0P05DRAFT_527547 [Gilbertella persicaria]|uniref:uncharacterized protein n=1 Tax=Gilbertella persicaria TaxID=101096 RepID=UPI002220D7E0|nr:uncharacterized protein B0P05DRAFT_527547 [Gilbertella persicaria]KAI8091446.1 hypothetical protein B0P05DRAFT_527547 [Gilbertella persicaria]
MYDRTMWETERHNLDAWTLQWLLAKATCSIQSEKDRTQKGLEKAKVLVAETEEKVRQENDKIHQVEVQNEKYAVDYRELQKYREEFLVLLDKALPNETSKTQEYKDRIEETKQKSQEKFENIKKLDKVKEYLKNADLALLEAILELRASTVKESLMGQGKVYFPETAYECLAKAREEYPDLPGFASPTEYVNEADNTGAYYSPMQKYLWDVRKKIADLILWCDEEAISLLDKETELQIELGQYTDEYNLRRRDALKNEL